MISALARKSFFNLFPSKSAYRLPESHILSSPPVLFFSTVAASVSSEHLPTKNPKKSELFALFLKENGFSDTQLEKVLKSRQQLRYANLEKSVKPKITVFQEFGFSSYEIADIITKEPTILCRSLTNTVYPSLSLLRDLLGSNDDVVKVVLRKKRFYRSDFKKTLCPNIEILKNCGVPMERILLLLRSFPTSIFISPELLRKHIDKLERLEINPSSKVYIYALWAVASMSNEVWDLKLQTFKDLGFSESECLKAFKKSPQFLTTSPEKIKRIAEAVLATKKYTASCILANPLCLCCSLEKRLKPRLKVLEILEKNNVIKEWPNLTGIYSYTDEKFNAKFVAPYPSLFSEISSFNSQK